MTTELTTARRRPSPLSLVLIVTSIAASVAIALAMDIVLVRFTTNPPLQILTSAVLFNATCIVQSVVGAIIEWRRPGHRIGRLLMLSGPLYALLGATWSGSLGALVDPELFRVLSWGLTLLSWPGVALIAGWLPLLFPTGTLPGPRWRIPAGLIVLLSSIGLASLAVRPGPIYDGTTTTSPIAIDGWPAFLQVFVDAIPLELLAVFFLAVAGLIARYRRGDRVERAQIRWFVAALAITSAGFVSTIVEIAVRTDDGPLLGALVSYAGILAMPITIGIAITRYRLYEIDRIVSRTIGWAAVTGVLVAVFACTVVGLQALLARFTEGDTLAVAASTLVAFALFQPVRRRVQRAVDRRFDRARYDGERTASAFGERLREQVDLADLEADIADTIRVALRPSSTGIWIRDQRHEPTR
jgi:hypothetical protein